MSQPTYYRLNGQKPVAVSGGQDRYRSSLALDAALPAPFSAHRSPSVSAPIAGPVASPILRGGSVEPFAVRNELRRDPLRPLGPILQKCAGIALTGLAWLVFLWGMAHLVIAALHNSAGELGVGIDATVNGAKCCLAAFVLAAAGVPQWMFGQRKLDRVRVELN